MNLSSRRMPSPLQAHWFFLAAAIVLLADAALLRFDHGASPRLLEIGLLLDLAVVLPALYYWCYRKTRKGAVWRALALACLGIWAAGYIISQVIPEPQQSILPSLRILRYLSLAVLLALELKLMIALYRAVFSGQSGHAEKAMTDAGMPRWAVRVMAWEAAFWQRAWQVLRRWFR